MKHSFNHAIPYLLQSIFLFCAYFITARFGLALGAVSGFAALVWPPTGIALSALLLGGYQFWPALFLGAFFVNFVTGAPFYSALGMGIGNTLEAIFGAYLLKRVKFSPKMERLRDVLSLLFFGSIISTSVSALTGATSLWFGRVIQRQDYTVTWSTWWVGDILGSLIIAPFIMVWATWSWPKFKTLQLVEAIFLAITLIILALLIFETIYPKNSRGIPISYAIFPFVIWAALRFGQIGSVTTTLVLSTIMIWKTTRGSGPFVRETLSESLFFLQLFMGITAITGMIMAAVMTERKRANQALQMAYEISQTKFQLLVDGIRDYAIFMIDPKGTIVSWNKGAETIKGYKAEEIIGKHFSIFYVPEDIARHKPELALEIAKTQGKFEEENWWVKKDGSRYWASILITRIDHEGKLIGFSKVIRDLSERKIAEEKLQRAHDDLEKRVGERTIELARANEFLKQSETRLNLATEFGKIGIWEWNLADNLFWNPEHEIQFGYTPGTPHRSMEDFTKRVHPDDRELLAKARQRAIETHSAFEFDFRIILPSGEIRWFSAKAKPDYDISGQVIKMLGANIDVTESKRAADEKERLVKRLQTALASRDEFIGIASHELKTPLTSLKMQLELTQRLINPEKKPSPPPEKLVKILSTSSTQVDRLTTLINDLLDVSRIQAGRLTYHFESVNLSELVQQVLDLHSDEFIQAKCSLESQVEPNIIGQWDRSRIEQLLLNLISNALKYARGTLICIELHRLHNQVEIIVQDHGPGIPQDKLETIFERYERATSSINISGMGLGLFISKRIVEGHHGTIQVESEIGKGSKFIVHLLLSPTEDTHTSSNLEDKNYGI